MDVNISDTLILNSLPTKKIVETMNINENNNEKERIIPFTGKEPKEGF